MVGRDFPVTTSQLAALPRDADRRSQKSKRPAIRPALVALLLFLCLLLVPSMASANDIESIDVTAVLHRDGSMTITDHRIFNADEGTEHYLSLGNLADSEITDFSVTEHGRPLEDVGEWDVDASFEEKAGKYGINYTGDGVELCFGLGSYGRRDFTITYRVTNVVKQLTDGAQTIYWQFINPDMDPIDRVKIALQNDVGLKYAYPDTRLWGFGWKGKTGIGADALTMETGASFATSDYMVMLAIFPEGSFGTTSELEKSSEELIAQAMEGATLPEDPGEMSTYEDVPSGIAGEMGQDEEFVDMGSGFAPWLGVFPLAVIGVAGVAIFSAFKSSRSTFSSAFEPTIGKEEYYRDLPYDGPFDETGYLLNVEETDVISAFLLKWMREGRLVQRVLEEQGLIFKKTETQFDLKDVPGIKMESHLERILWALIEDAAGTNRILEHQELNRYITKHTDQYARVKGAVKADSKAALLRKNYLFTEEKKWLFLKYNDVSLTESGQELVNRIQGFRQYLKDFSLLEERGSSEVFLWDTLLIWAAYLGIADEVYKQFQIVDPGYEQATVIDRQSFYYAHLFARGADNVYQVATAPASSGGGGSSFSGGGGGSFGGGSGGGTR